MTKNLLLSTLIFAFSSNLYSYTTPLDVSAYREELTNMYSNVSSQVKDYVVNFTISRDCLEELQELNSYLSGCMDDDDDIDKKKEEYRKSKQENLNNLENLIKKGTIAESKYSADDFKFVLETLTWKKDTLKYQILKKSKKPTFPISLLFPWEQKESIIKALFQKEASQYNRYKKIKVLIDLAKEADHKVTILSNSSGVKSEDPSEDYTQDKEVDFYKQEELESLSQTIDSLNVEKAVTEAEISYYEGKKLDLSTIDEETGMTLNEVDSLINNLKAKLEQINADITENTNELQELQNLTLEQQNERISLVKRVLRSRVSTKGDIFCPNIMHFAAYNNDLDTTKLVIETYRNMMAVKTADEDKTKRRVSRYLDETTYDPQKLSEAQNEYLRSRAKDKDTQISACFYASTTNRLSKATIIGINMGIVNRGEANERLNYRKQLDNPSKYTPLMIAYTFWKNNQANIEATFSIILELLKSGATYKEDLTLVYDNEDKSNLLNKLPKDYSTIFEDFLMIGGDLNKYQTQKKQIVDALTTYHLTRQQKRNLQDRDLSLLKQSVDNKNAYWCSEILNLAKKDDETFDSNIPFKAKWTILPKSNKDQRKYDRATRWKQFISNSDGQKMHYNKSAITKKIVKNISGALTRKQNKTIKTILDDLAPNTPCETVIKKAYDDFVIELSNNLPTDLTTWNYSPNEPIFSIIHYKTRGNDSDKRYHVSDNYFDKVISKLSDKKANLTWVTTRYPTNEFKQSIGKALADFIVTAKDAYGNTPWDYGKNRIWRSDYSGNKDNIKDVKEFLRKKHSLWSEE